VLLRSQRIVRMTAQRQIVRSGGPTECVWVHMVKLEKSRLPTALASVINIGAPRAIALPHLAPHRRSNRLAPALALVLFGWLTISLRLALALARISWLAVSLRLALAPARFGRRGSRPLHLGAAALLQLRDEQAHGLRSEERRVGKECGAAWEAETSKLETGEISIA